MRKTVELVLPPEHASDEERQKDHAAGVLGIDAENISFIRKLKRSIDARSSKIVIRLLAEIYYGEPAPAGFSPKREYQSVRNSRHVIVAGSGPGGLFAALRLIELGLKPIIIERGKEVRSRRRDLAAINKEHIVNPESNYCFGEGGAGTYSDGKLYTRSSKRGDVSRILSTLVDHGAQEDILIDAHPHIGTNKLPGVITAIRKSILDSGGEIHFNTRMDDILIKDGKVRGIRIHDGSVVEGDALILATGHSARDVFQLLDRKGIRIEAKPFALGLRIEHPQQLIDSIRYHCSSRNPHLPAASYSFASEVNGKGVYSFCMCPGGFIVPAATAPGEIVVNGMSPSRRDSEFANSGIVTAVDMNEAAGYFSKLKREVKASSPLLLLEFQQEIERAAFGAGGGGQTAPAQCMVDFVNNKLSASPGKTSYRPGIKTAPLHEILPPFIASRLQHGLRLSGNKMKGYFTNEAVLLGVESRTSSPVRIPRDPLTLQHPEVEGLYPCGEGAGYAGGIVSAAVDGERCAEQCKERMKR